MVNRFKNFIIQMERMPQKIYVFMENYMFIIFDIYSQIFTLTKRSKTIKMILKQRKINFI